MNRNLLPRDEQASSLERRDMLAFDIRLNLENSSGDLPYHAIDDDGRFDKLQEVVGVVEDTINDAAQSTSGDFTLSLGVNPNRSGSDDWATRVDRNNGNAMLTLDQVAEDTTYLTYAVLFNSMKGLGLDTVSGWNPPYDESNLMYDNSTFGMREYSYYLEGDQVDEISDNTALDFGLWPTSYFIPDKWVGSGTISQEYDWGD